MINIRESIEKYVMASLARYLAPAPTIPGLPEGHRVIDVYPRIPQEDIPCAIKLTDNLQALGVTAEMLKWLRADCAHAFGALSLSEFVTLFDQCAKVSDLVDVLETEYCRAMKIEAGTLNDSDQDEDLNDTPRDGIEQVASNACSWDHEPSRRIKGSVFFMVALALLTFGIVIYILTSH